MRVYDMIIVGGGPAGYTAALYGARAGLKVLVLEKLSAGGQMALSHQVDNYPGFPDGIDGFTLAGQMQQQAEKSGAETEYAEVLRLALSDTPKVVETDMGCFYGKTVALATGARPKKLGVAGEDALAGRGVAYCAACDGMFFKGKTVAVVGGGNSAVSDALHLSRIAKKVILIHRRDTLRADKVYDAALREANNIRLLWNRTVSGLLRDGKLTGLRLRDVHSGEESEIACDGVFVSIGRSPDTTLVAGQLELDGQGYIPAPESTKTSIPGVFAIGDVRQKALRQIITAAADGAVAAHEAAEYLSKMQ